MSSSSKAPVGPTSPRAALLIGASLALVGGAPADRVPTPRAEPCVVFDADPEEGGMAAPEGLGYDDVKQSLNAVIQSALYCTKPAEMTEVHLTFELVVGCDGLVSAIEATDDGGAPAPYVACVSSVIRKADFPAHDLPDGMPVTYPLDVSW